MMNFDCSLYDGEGRSRLYSSFYIVFQDGTLLSKEGYYLENPQVLAANRAPFAWVGSMKALTDVDADDAAEMGVTHVSCEVSLSELMNGSERLLFLGNEYTLSAEVLSRLDQQISAAAGAGHQVTLALTVDSLPSVECFVAVADALAARYAENGSVSAILLKLENFDSAAELCRASSLALRSRAANGRVYVTAPVGLSLADTRAFFEELQTDLAMGGEISWWASVIPQTSYSVPWEATDAGGVTVRDLVDLSSGLLSSVDECRAAGLAVYDVAFDAADEDVQAASYAYTYRLAADAGIDLLFYRDHVDVATGLRNGEGESRRIVSVLSDIDVGLSSADESLCATLIGGAWDKLGKTVTRVQTSGTSNTGTAGLEENPLFDFTTGESYDFCGVGSLTNPKTHPSGALNAPVLYTWLSPDFGQAGGVRKVLANGQALRGATSLSVSLLTQIPNVSTATAVLRLEGVREDGSRVSYISDVEIANGSWQTVTFGVSSFSAEIDVSKPCVMTLTTEPQGESNAEYVLWVSGINVRYPVKQSGMLLPVVVIAACVSVSFFAFFLIYRNTAGRTRVRRR